jgi:hypothetical protein
MERADFLNSAPNWLEAWLLLMIRQASPHGQETRVHDRTPGTRPAAIFRYGTGIAVQARMAVEAPRRDHQRLHRSCDRSGDGGVRLLYVLPSRTGVQWANDRNPGKPAICGKPGPARRSRLGAAGAGVWWGFAERKKRNRERGERDARIAALEKKVDPSRTSSGLDPQGNPTQGPVT